VPQVTTSEVGVCAAILFSSTEYSYYWALSLSFSLGQNLKQPGGTKNEIHTKNAIAAGASEAEIREAVATAAQIRLWSTVLNGMGYDFDTFKAEVDKIQSRK